MLSNLSLRTKILLPIASIITLTGMVFSYTNFSTIDNLMAENEQAELTAYMDAFDRAIQGETMLAETLSAFVANMPFVQAQMANDKRDELNAQLVPAYKVLAEHYGAKQFQFHKPLAISYFRVHKPQKFGDDLSSFRHTVANTNQKQVITTGIEKGVAGIGLRAVVPVFQNNKHLGSVEFGMSFDQHFLDEFKAQSPVEVNIHLIKDKGFERFAGTTKAKMLTDPQTLKQTLKGTTQAVHAEVDGQHYAVMTSLIKDYSGTPIAVVEMAMDNTHNLELMQRAYSNAILVGLMVLALGIGLSILIANYFTRRIASIATNVDKIAQGDLTSDIEVSGTDELAKLAEAANRMRLELQKIVGEVHNHSKSITQSAHTINEAVESQAANSSEMSSSVAEITSTMEELSASSTQIAEHSTSVVEVANQTMTGSYKGSEAMQLVLARMTDIRTDNEASLEEIVDLGAKSKQIGKIMSLITNLADQTKLIAFNAALEASSAGEAGKRFSVVASEIRRLADSVTDSTGEIENKINEIQSAISRLVVSSEKRAQSIIAGTKASNETAERFNEIVSAANQTSVAAQQISLSTQQQKIASEQVVTALREIVITSSNTANAITQMSQVSNEMTQLSEQLYSTTDAFKLEQDK